MNTGWLIKYRLIELTTNSDKKKYKPQVLLCENIIKTGILFWKKTEILEDWCGFYVEPDNTYMFNYKESGRHELIFDSIDEAKEAIKKFKADMEVRYQINNDKTFKKAKIIDISN